MYFGIGSTSNRVRWIVFSVLVLIFAALIIAWGVVFAEMKKALNDCIESKCQINIGAKFQCSDLDQVMKQCIDIHESLVAAYFVLLVAWIVALLVASIPLYVMCCCTKKPSDLKAPLYAP